MSWVSQDRAENRLLVRVGKPKQNGPAAFGCDRRRGADQLRSSTWSLGILTAITLVSPYFEMVQVVTYAGGMGFVKGCNRRLRAKEGVSRLREYPTFGRMLN